MQQCICVPGMQPSTQTGSTAKGGEELQPPEPPMVWWPFLLGLNLPEQQPLIAMGKQVPAGCLCSLSSTSSHLPCQLLVVAAEAIPKAAIWGQESPLKLCQLLQMGAAPRGH